LQKGSPPGPTLSENHHSRRVPRFAEGELVHRHSEDDHHADHDYRFLAEPDRWAWSGNHPTGKCPLRIRTFILFHRTNFGRYIAVAKRHTLDYDVRMKYFSWNDEKNEQLKRERGVSFEEVVFHLDRDELLDIVEHPNPEKYKGQRMFIVNIEDYAYLVPFIETDEEVFLKTIIPSRKATKKYMKRKKK
jgi:uncharacterized DUF497 family protein